MPTLLYDGDCGFCQRCAGLARRVARRTTVAAFQDVDIAAFGLTPEECAEALRYVDAAGATYRGHVAVDAFLRDSGSWWRWLRWPLHVPGTQRLWSRLYDLVARNRTRLPGGTPQCEVPPR